MSRLTYTQESTRVLWALQYQKPKCPKYKHFIMRVSILKQGYELWNKELMKHGGTTGWEGSWAIKPQIQHNSQTLSADQQEPRRGRLHCSFHTGAHTHSILACFPALVSLGLIKLLGLLVSKQVTIKFFKCFLLKQLFVLFIIIF